MTGRNAVGLAILTALMVLNVGCSGTPQPSRQVSRSVLGELFVVTD